MLTDLEKELLEAVIFARKEIVASGNWEARDFGWPEARKRLEAAIKGAKKKEAGGKG